MSKSSVKPPKKGKGGLVVIALMIVFFASVLVFSVIKIITGVSAYEKADDIYDGLRESFVSVRHDIPKEEPSVGGASGISDSDSSASEGMTVDSHKQSDDVPISVDFDILTEYNSDVVGWLYCEGTPLNYPVVQADDNDYYLRRGLDGESLITGTVFADYRCTEPCTDAGYVIYGHDMDNGTIFGMLKNYASQEYYDAHPVIWYLTPEGDYRIDVYTGTVISADDRIYRVGVEDEDLVRYVRSLAVGSGVTTHIDVTDNDRFIVLSTCSDEYADARFILIGRVSEADYE